MFLSGIADEAGKPIAKQIAAHKQLGWTEIEVRNVDSVNLADMPDEKFEATFAALQEAGMHVSCFASQLGNWARPITNDFDADLNELKTAIPRMHRCNTTFIRTMSWPNDKDNPWPDAEWKKEALRRLRELTKIAEDGGVVLVHENCSGWGGQGPEQALALIDEIDSPAFKLVYDTGNVIGHGHDGWDYYNQVKPHVVYVHIKDRKVADGKNQACFAGEGQAYVREIVTDLLQSGYDDGFSIEPHIAAAVHLGKEAEDARAYDIYVEYGQRFQKLMEQVQAGLQ